MYDQPIQHIASNVSMGFFWLDMGVSLLYAAAQLSYKCMTRQILSISCQKAKCNDTGPVCWIESYVGLVDHGVSMIREPPKLMHVPLPESMYGSTSHHIPANGQAVSALGVNANRGSEDDGGRTMVGGKTHGMRP